MVIKKAFLGILFLSLSVSIVARQSGTCIGTFTLKSYEDIQRKQLAKKRASKANVCPSPIRVLAMVDSDFSPSVLAKEGWRTVSRVSDIVTLEGCYDQIPSLIGLTGIKDVQLPGPLVECMDSVQIETGLDILNGKRPSTGLPYHLKGKGILVGVIDIEFDIHHPAFIGPDNKTRFIALWDQADSSGAKNNSYGYGTIKRGDELNADSSFGRVDGVLHGTHIASIVTGSELDKPYYGFAPEADIIAVKRGKSDAEIIDGIKWIFSVADERNMPCVINISLGSHNGPHDGTSLIDRSIDSLTGAGRIVVGGVGNDAPRQVHTTFTLENNNAAGTWAHQKVVTNDITSTGLELWGEPGKLFSVDLFVLDTSSMNYVRSSQPITIFPFQKTIYPPDTVDIGDDKVLMQWLTDPASALNNKPHVKIIFRAGNIDLCLGVRLSSLQNCTVHGWNLAHKPNRALDVSGITGTFVNGDGNSSIIELGGSGKSIISVGSYALKTAIHRWDGEVIQKDPVTYMYDLSPFSSWGPTIDGRTKPEITAPGNAVVAAMSRTAYDSLHAVLWPNHPQPHGRYVPRTGTSISAPIVAGIVALMLEADEALTPQKIKDILQETAKTDSYTGPISTPDNKWGAGKADGLVAVSSVLGINVTNAIAQKKLQEKVEFVRFQENMLRIGMPGSANDETYTVTVSDLQGRIVFHTSLSSDKSIHLPVSSTAGMRIITVIKNDVTVFVKKLLAQ